MCEQRTGLAEDAEKQRAEAVASMAAQLGKARTEIKSLVESNDLLQVMNPSSPLLHI